MAWLTLGIVIGILLGIWIGSNSPQTFRWSRRALEKIAGDAMTKAKALAAKGKG